MVCWTSWIVSIIAYFGYTRGNETGRTTMRKLLIISLMAFLLVGCKKARQGNQNNSPNQGSQDGPSGGVINPGDAGGGAVQAVRQAVTRTVVLSDLHNLQLFIENASLSNGKMPTIPEIQAVIKQQDPKTHMLLKDYRVILTGAKRREEIWAYSREPQSGNQHLVLSASGIEKMDAQTLEKRLKDQGLPGIYRLPQQR
jgi:hypothetical protein